MKEAFLVACVIGACLLAVFVGGRIVGIIPPPGAVISGTTPNQHLEYRDDNRDGFVNPQGDPLYDEHYAKNVNVPNSQALETLGDAAINQAQAQHIQAETQQLRVGTNLTYAILVVVAIILLIFVMGYIIR
jgi:hypothetical protein